MALDLKCFLTYTLKLVQRLSAVQVVGGKAPTNLKGPKKSGLAMPPSICTLSWASRLFRVNSVEYCLEIHEPVFENQIVSSLMFFFSSCVMLVIRGNSGFPFFVYSFFNNTFAFPYHVS